MPLQATSGAASYDAFGGGVPVAVNYIEDVFSTYLYTGTGATQTITNGINLSANGGLVWSKVRSTSASHALSDTANGVSKYLSSDTISAISSGFGVTAFNTDGFNSPAFAGGSSVVSWTFREQPKFFDVVTFTQTGNTGYTTVNHNLGSVPGCIIMKCTSTASTWAVYHRSIPLYGLSLNNTWDTSVIGQPAAIDVTSTEFKLNNTDWGANNSATWVAYVFAHNAGGFGLTGTDNVISCGSFTSSAGGLATVNLGYEPQWVMVKGSSAVTNWQIMDTMRGFVVGAANSGSKYLNANSSSAELDTPPYGLTNTGFNFDGAPNITYIYIAIRRGPMKVPTTGTSVFNTLTYTGNGTSGRLISGAGFPPDLLIQTASSSSENREFDDRLRGGGSTAMNALFSNSTNAEAADSGSVQLLNQDGFTVRSFGNGSGVTYLGWNFRRAPSFCDVVCYTGTGVARTQTHNLAAVPELMIVKVRNDTESWTVYSAATGNTKILNLNNTNAQATGTEWNNTTPTSSVFSLGTFNSINGSGLNYVAYLFATCAGVSKVGSYTGTATTKQIDCGFTAGARFVLIKRTDSTGDWYVWDSARGIVAGNDPYLLLNSTAAEVTSTDYIDTYSAGFEISSTAPAAINASGGTFIFLAIA
jgi:hypothetical protein